jgi:4,5-DOPA dioxygenase extradiol
VGSGSVTHNLRDFMVAVQSGGATPPYVRPFADWLASHLAQHDTQGLLDYRRSAPEAERAHPTEEHLLPLYVAMGAGGVDAAVERFHAGIDDYVLAMDGYAFRAH